MADSYAAMDVLQEHLLSYSRGGHAGISWSHHLLWPCRASQRRFADFTGDHPAIFRSSVIRSHRLWLHQISFPDGRGSGHAGRGETSVLWTLEPDCVDVSRIPAEGTPGPHFAMGADARESDRRIGELMVADGVQRLGEKAKELLDEYSTLQPAHKPLSFDQVEEMWEREIWPRIGNFKAMQDPGEDREIPPQDSRWYTNWHVPDRK